MVWAPEGRKVGSLKRRARSHLARWEMKNCMPLRREGHFEVKMYKALHVRTTFGSWHVEKVHAVVAWSTFSKSKRAKQTMLFWKLRCSKSARRCGAKHISKSNVLRTDVSDISDHFWTLRCHSDVVLCGRRKGFRFLIKISKMWGFCSRQGRRGTFEEDLQRCTSRGRRSTREMFIRDVRRSGRWFPAMGCILVHQLFRFAKMILRDGCNTSYDLASLFRGRRSNYFRQMEWRNHKTHWYKAVSSALNFPPFLKEVSQKCFVFDVVNFENGGSLAKLLRFFWRCQLRKLRECVFDVVKFKNWGSLAG